MAIRFRVPFLKAGPATSGDGTALDITVAMLRDIAESYDPALHEAPYVIGHPEHNKPAFGWASNVVLEDGQLVAESENADEALIALFEEGKFRKISASIYAPDAPNNPAPGHYSLRHVGFLGAQPPAIKGLANPKVAQAISLADDEAGVISLTDYDQMSVANLFRRLREWLIGDRGQETADRVLPSYEIESLQLNAIDRVAPKEPINPPASTGLAYAEGEHSADPTKGGDRVSTKTASAGASGPEAKTVELAEREANIAAQEADIKARAAALAAQEAAARAKAHLDFLDSLVKAGQVLPAEKAGLQAVLVATDSNTQVLEFGEGDAKQSGTAQALLQSFLKGLPKRIEFGELAGGAAAPQEMSTDPAAIANQILAYCEAEKLKGRIVDVATAAGELARARAA